jgi:hypothetical protein
VRKRRRRRRRRRRTKRRGTIGFAATWTARGLLQ